MAETANRSRGSGCLLYTSHAAVYQVHGRQQVAEINALPVGQFHGVHPLQIPQVRVLSLIHISAGQHHDIIVVLAGSLPVNAPADTYRVWGDACREKGAKVMLDSDGAGMVEGVKAKPFLIKPNSEELSHLMGRALDSQQEMCIRDRGNTA